MKIKKPIYIYKIDNLDNDLPYVGRSVNPKSRRTNHMWKALTGEDKYNDCAKFYNSIRAHGVDRFSEVQILDVAYTKEDAFRLENFYIEKYDAVENGLNCNYGGKGGMPGYKFSEKSKQKMSDTAKKVGKAKGSKNPKATINEQQVRQIKVMLITNTIREVSDIMKITYRKIKRIKIGETWAHIKV